MSSTVDVVAAGTFLLMGAWVAVANWACVYLSARNQRRGIDRHHSTVPLASIVLVAIAYLIYPARSMQWAFLIPAFDIANLLLLILPHLLWVEWRRQRRA